MPGMNFVVTIESYIKNLTQLSQTFPELEALVA